MSQVESKVWNSSYGYWGLVIIGLITFPITQDFGATGICLALALAFNPFNDKPYPEWSKTQKALILGQLALSAFFVGFYLYTVVAN